MRAMPILALGAALLTAGCYDAYGRMDPTRTALLGAGIGAAAGLGVAAASQPRYDYGPRHYHAPPPRAYYGPPRGYYRGW
ncbi:hypothetical protein GXW74_14100 [Roseomonas eburnea]|uniref:Lipoprotein n=1 Tax=Neoroseomonas eburnea TaxID=1346889 RepID=A0A9X9XD39_9PROT|nr:hypothetical protein [Neoroseomonas eburnea]MBR0681625.1 hypothetical protein [Neoroseomonas eburnea]